MVIRHSGKMNWYRMDTAEWHEISHLRASDGHCGFVIPEGSISDRRPLIVLCDKCAAERGWIW